MMRRSGWVRSSSGGLELVVSLALASAVAAQAGTVLSEQKISETTGGFGGVLDASDQFGDSVAALGDLDGDGIGDFAVGARFDDDGGTNQGAVWILFLNADGTVASEQKISETTGGFGGVLDPSDFFGVSVAALGDLDGDGVTDLAVGAYGDDDGGADQGAVWILFLNSDGTVASEQKISETTGGFGGVLDGGDQFGFSVSSLGDLDGDGITDLAVGSVFDDDGGFNQGAVWILFLNSDGTVASEQAISETTGGFGGALDPSDLFAVSVAALGDLDGDGVTDLAVGARFDDDGGADQGAVWILFLNADGTVASEQKISETTGGFGGVLDSNDRFGESVAALGDLDGDGIADLAVGTQLDDDGGSDQGAVWILFLNADGTVASEQKISETTGGFGGVLDPGDSFGRSVAALGDLDGDGSGDLAVGAFFDDDGGGDQGAVWILFLEGDTVAPVITCPSDITTECTSPAGAVVSFTVTATDDHDPAPSIVSVPSSGSTFPLGTTTVTSTATDNAGNSAMCTFDVTVEDTTPPIVTCPSDITTECTGPSGAVVSFTPTATDVCDPSPSIVAVPASGSTFPHGTTTVTVTATDDEGNSSMCTFDVTVEDTTSPVIVCPSDMTVECTSPSGAAVSFSPSVSDTCDPAPGLVCVPASGSTFPMGTTTVTCTATDDAGNSAMCTFDVTVEDTTPPVVTCPSDITAECTSPAGAAVSFTPTATDVCDPSPSIMSVPASGSTFPMGTTTVTVTATDDEGNSALCTFDVTVEDTTSPVVTCPSDITVECTSPAGAAVSFTPTATDVCDPAPAIVAVPASGSTFALGTTTVTVTATDAEGNSAMCSFDITVEDTTPPVVTCPADIVKLVNVPGGGWTVSFAPSASDVCDPAPSIVSVPSSGSLFPIGTTSVTCTATDAEGNSAMCSFDVTVKRKGRRFEGPPLAVVVLPTPVVLPSPAVSGGPWAGPNDPGAEPVTTLDFPFTPAEPLLFFETAGARVELADGARSYVLHEPEAGEEARSTSVFADLARLFPRADSGTRLTLVRSALAPASSLANVRFHGGASLRNGSDANELVLVSAGTPRAGAEWQAWIDVSAHAGASASLVVVSERPLAGRATPLGELLVDVVSRRPLFTSVVPSSGATDVHALALPAELLGRAFSLQALILDEEGSALTNAIDLVVGGGP